MPSFLVRASVACAVLTWALSSGCGEDLEPAGPSPPLVVSVELSSPIGGLMALGRTVQLNATATDAHGETLTGVAFAWESTNPSIATVSGSGLVTAVAEGSFSILASADGVTGSLQMGVVDADLNGISAVLTDPFVDLLVSHLSSATRTDVEEALAGCSAAVATGALEAIRQYLASAQSEVPTATDADDKILLAVLGLVLDHAERLLNL